MSGKTIATGPIKGRANGKVFTTGQISKICMVAPRTVSKWFDSGRLKGYRVPGSNDRRVPREELIRFLREHGLPLGDLARSDRPSLLCVGTPDEWVEPIARAFPADLYDTWTTASVYRAGAIAHDSPPTVAVVRFAGVGRYTALEMVSSICVHPKTDRTRLVGIAAEDEADLDRVAAEFRFAKLLQEPCGVEAVIEAVQLLLNPETA